MKYDSKIIQMLIQDFCARQSNLIIQEVFDSIKNNFTDMRSLKSQNSGLFECNKENIGDYIKRVYESECHNRYIRVPKPLQDYLYVKEVVNEEVLNNRINLHA